jgi:hypothetical protein
LITAFEQLADYRKSVRVFCNRHYHSIEYFHARPSYAVHRSEIDSAKIGKGDIRHLTSSVTCFESLFDCPTEDRPLSTENLKALATEYSDGAVKLPDEKWTSDESARIYCRCRTLPFVVRHISQWSQAIERFADEIFVQMDNDTRFAIGEAPINKPDEWYPPNAYHTFFALQLIDELARFEGHAESPAVLKLRLKRPQLIEWARKVLAYQVSLHDANSSELDSDQLAWSLAIVIQFSQDFQSKLAEQDFIRQAFKCLFQTQTEVGSWPHYAPLFHYEKTGNAYCFFFETFAALLRGALRPESAFIRSVLTHYCAHLMKLISYASSTQTRIDAEAPVAVWASGHRTNSQAPESWATASVYSYAQNLRRLLGVWAREAALFTLPRRPSESTKKDSLKTLQQRAATWTSLENLNEQLLTMFVNHVSSKRSEDVLQPDAPPIGADYCRSAILFGPPGASKTTIIRALAGSIGWDYIELYASHFVADGLPNVQRKADEIFKRLMEIDRAIVFFDEIDELVRGRDGGSDSFGRFLTTSMLPKLAELWDSRKVMYFVATNHINYFDPAITRSQRFDAVIFVSPPSFDAKTTRLQSLLTESAGHQVEFAVSKSDIDGAFPKFKDGVKQLEEKALPGENTLAKFALLRWDELSELANHLTAILADASVVDENVLAKALTMVQDGRWRTLKDYYDYLNGEKFERRDYSKLSAWVVEGLDENDLPSGVAKIDDRFVLGTLMTEPATIKIEGFELERIKPGTLMARKRLGN